MACEPIHLNWNDSPCLQSIDLETQVERFEHTMNTSAKSLEEAVQAVYEKACTEEDYEVAEYLLKALEALARRDGNTDKLDQCYLVIASAIRRAH